MNICVYSYLIYESTLRLHYSVFVFCEVGARNVCKSACKGGLTRDGGERKEERREARRVARRERETFHEKREREGSTRERVARETRAERVLRARACANREDTHETKRVRPDLRGGRDHTPRGGEE